MGNKPKKEGLSDSKTQGKSKAKKEKIITENDIMKYEIAAELGLMDKIQSTGWKSLTARESGRIGGLITKRKRKKQEENQANSRF